MSKNKTKALMVFSLIIVLVLGVFAMSSCSTEQEPVEPEEPEEVKVIANPFTGETPEDGFDENALNQRTVAFVVENTPDARPQWGMDDPDYSPDMVLQGEVEGGITRTLWFYADYNKLPEIIGPMRSARPPYIKFSELFDSVFIHWGQSASKGDYVGANTVFHKDKVDHINQMTFKGDCGLFDRDYTRTTSLEHRGILYGSKVPEALVQKGVRMEPEESTALAFNDLSWLTTFEPAKAVNVRYSDFAASQSTHWTYNEKDRKYHTTDFYNDFARDNLLVLIDKTEYITKYNYMNTGASVVYCNYKFKKGTGKLFSQGKVKDIEWKVKGGKLILIDTELTKRAQERAEAAKAAAEEEAEANGSGQTSGEASENEAAEGETAEPEEPIVIPASFNKGKTWIGWISGNNGGGIEIIND